MSGSINQKEYLKRYLGIGKAPGEKKKKKKKEKNVNSRMKIIDDDVDVLLSREIADDLTAANEDAPQIVAIIDERPPSLQIDEKTQSNMWKPVGEIDNNLDVQSQRLSRFKININHQGRSTESYKNDAYIKNEKNKNYGDSSPHRKIHGDSTSKKYTGGESPSKKKYKQPYLSPGKEEEKDNDYSPPRKSQREEASSSRRKNRERSSSPRIKTEDYSALINDSPHMIKNEKDSLTPHRNNGDNSPPRRRRNKEDEHSPSRRKNKEEDYSPIRRRNKERGNSLSPKQSVEDNSPPRRRNKDRDRSLSPKQSARDNSPPRRRNQEMCSSSPQKEKFNKDRSPSIRPNKERNLPSKRKTKEEVEKRVYADDKLSPERTNKRGERSPLREHEIKGKRLKRSRWNSEEPSESSVKSKMQKTLDGKQAGLQKAEDLVKESKYLKQKEDEMFGKMSAEISGRYATTVMRGKKIQDLEEEAAKEKKQKEIKEKYDLWGKGLKQVEDHSKKIEDQLHEMSKPLARYADDEDLEKFLKEQEREGDPMLAYIRKKKKKERVDAGIPGKKR